MDTERPGEAEWKVEGGNTMKIAGNTISACGACGHSPWDVRSSPILRTSTAVSETAVSASADDDSPTAVRNAIRSIDRNISISISGRSRVAMVAMNDWFTARLLKFVMSKELQNE